MPRHHHQGVLTRPRVHLIDPSLDAAATLFESGDQQQQYRVLVLPLSVWVRLPLWPIHNLAELSLEAVHT